ncbi:MAG: Pr6Pr family membrane protein [Actinobacteria bacterium]|nr:Pr6Pr family membrane protein [Actinomycetota bacterium]
MARVWFAATALVILFGLLVQVLVVVDVEQVVFFDTPAGRIFNVFCFFTIQSNLIVAITCLLLALDPTRSSTVFRVFRLTGIVAIAITGVVYHSALKGLLDLSGWELVADEVLHTVSPIIAVAGWLVFGPRGLTSRRIVWWTLAFPACWFVFTLIRGEIVGFYPYPFVDVIDIGYARMLVNAAVVAVLYLGVAAGAHLLDRRLGRSRAIGTSAA